MDVVIDSSIIPIRNIQFAVFTENVGVSVCVLLESGVMKVYSPDFNNYRNNIIISCSVTYDTII